MLPPPLILGNKSAFTLIELSIVLVIIGLIIGGVLVGQDLINAAAIRAQISQTYKYNTAVHTFQLKYGYLPGDMPNPDAANFGMNQYARTLIDTDGNGNNANGNGSIDGSCTSCNGFQQYSFEHEDFWYDLATANLIDFVPTGGDVCPKWIATTTIDKLLPAAKIGNGNYVYVWSGGGFLWVGNYLFPNGANGKNYFGIAGINLSTDCNHGLTNTNMTVSQAYNIDQKIDDGLPQSGRVTATYTSAYPANLGNTVLVYAAGPNQVAAPHDTSAWASSPTSCFDNGGVAGVKQQYSLQQNNGNGMNCALSFEFQ